mmetsp:Transcript_10563/g.30061  ORF Transcript_10563/g.30061 Transcript_10563/m.30061 type:complete len:253 (+) Transcript_10563:92-850(+)
MLGVTVEVEYQQQELAKPELHPTNTPQKYVEKFESLRETFVEVLEEEGFDVIVRTKQPPAGYVEANRAGWYRPRRVPGNLAAPDPPAVQFPRSFAFEVTVSLTGDWDAVELGLPRGFEAFSKLRTRKWPHVESLAAEVARVLKKARDCGDVSTHFIKDGQPQIWRLRGPTRPPPDAKPPMCFGVPARVLQNPTAFLQLVVVCDHRPRSAAVSRDASPASVRARCRPTSATSRSHGGAQMRPWITSPGCIRQP